MALDTRNRRSSSVGWGLLSLNLGPNPDNDIANVADRIDMGGMYGVDLTVSADVSGTRRGLQGLDQRKYRRMRYRR